MAQKSPACASSLRVVAAAAAATATWNASTPQSHGSCCAHGEVRGHVAGASRVRARRGKPATHAVHYRNEDNRVRTRQLMA